MSISYILRQIVESIMFVGGSFIEPADIAVSSRVVRIPSVRQKKGNRHRNRHLELQQTVFNELHQNLLPTSTQH